MTDTRSTTVNRTLRRQPNSAYRVREYLTEKEVDRLIEAARKRGRNGARDAAAILLAHRHGLRVSELCALRWLQIDLQHGRLHVNRAKGGIESVHPLHGPELRALRPLQGSGPYVFVTEAGTPVTHHGFCEWFSELALPQSCRFRFIRTCCVIQRDISSLMTRRTLDHWRTISGIATCRVRPDIRR